MKLLKTLILLITAVAALAFVNQQKPTIYIIGDSTTHNYNKQTWGWGTIFPDYFDPSKISIKNNAAPGRSTRSFINEGRWGKIDSLLKPGDYVMMVFGHNEGGKPDTIGTGARSVLKGIGDETQVLTWASGKKETVHTYGWYFRKFIKDTKAKGATPIVLSMIPRNSFRDGKVVRANNDYGKWAQEVAKQEGAIFIDMNSITADKYDKWGSDSVSKLFPLDHTHTNKKGATINAESVVSGIKADSKDPLNKYLKSN